MLGSIDGCRSYCGRTADEQGGLPARRYTDMDRAGPLPASQSRRRHGIASAQAICPSKPSVFAVLRPGWSLGCRLSGPLPDAWQAVLMTRSRRVVLIVSLMATTGLALVLGVTDPAPPLTYPTQFFVWNLMLAC